MNEIINTEHLPTDESKAKELIGIVSRMRSDTQKLQSV